MLAARGSRSDVRLATRRTRHDRFRGDVSRLSVHSATCSQNAESRRFPAYSWQRTGRPCDHLLRIVRDPVPTKGPLPGVEPTSVWGGEPPLGCRSKADVQLCAHPSRSGVVGRIPKADATSEGLSTGLRRQRPPSHGLSEIRQAPKAIADAS